MRLLLVLFTVLLAYSQQCLANNPPLLQNDSIRICKNAAVDSFYLFANDIDPDGDSLFITDTLIKPSHGQYAFDNGQLIYTPDAGYEGTDKIYIKICDNGTPSLCAYSFVEIQIDTCYPLNHAPIAGFDSLGACRNETDELLVLNNDTDSDGDSIFISYVYNHAQNGMDSLSNGKLFYRAILGYTGMDQIEYVVCDVPANHLPSQCDTQTVLINVVNCGGVNHAPTAQIDIVPGLEDAFIQLPFDPRDNDSDPDGDPLTWNAVLGPFNGTIVPFGSKWMYKPNLNFNGIDIMPYRVCDNGTPQKCAYSVVTFIIAAVNDPPVIRRDTFFVPEDKTDTLKVTANDTDVDGDYIRVNLFTLPSHGTVRIVNGHDVEYIPAANFNGDDRFTYEGCDSTKCAKAEVLIHVLPVNDPPVANPDSVFVLNDVMPWVPVLANDVDIDGDSLTVTAVDSTNCSKASVEFNTVLVLPVTGANCTGFDTLHYTVCDPSGACATSYIVVFYPLIYDSTVSLPQGISPNGDGKNDVLYFTNLEKFFPASLIIYNRYGYSVYSNDEYQNDWGGKNGNTNQDLPDGPYWYVLKLNNGKRLVNYCQIQR